jgi:phosphate transport system substrate-binding protein
MAKEKVIKDMLSWSINSGESEVSSLSYAPLPDSLKQKVLQTIYALP